MLADTTMQSVSFYTIYIHVLHLVPHYPGINSVNVSPQKSEQKMLLSGLHTISNITCKGCDTPLGWVYLKANDPAQRYKEGKS